MRSCAITRASRPGLIGTAWCSARGMRPSACTRCSDVGFFDRALLDGYTRLGSAFGDHPDMRKIDGIDFSSGSLGHGLSVSVGMALAARVQGRDYRTFCIAGDGELAEGQMWEAAMAAGQYRLAS